MPQLTKPATHPDTLRRFGWVGAIALGFAAGWTDPAAAQLTPVEETTLKAAFVYNFAKYTDWPDEYWSKSVRLRICTAGENDAFRQALSALATKAPVRGKNIEVRELARPADDATACHMLVVVGRQWTAAWLNGVRMAPVLTIGDGEGFAARGGMIGLVVEGDKLRFEINQEAAQQAGLKLSSQLLKLARLVRGEVEGAR